MVVLTAWTAGLPLLGVRALAGGALVVVFALISEVLKPKMFSGIFGAAPSVALASLLVESLTRGPVQTQPSALGMLAGAAGMVAYCLAAVILLPRLGGLGGSISAWAAWFAVAIGLYALVLG